MALGYLILAHKNPNQFLRLFRTIYDPEDFYALHIDRKASPDLHRAAGQLSSEFSNVQLIRPRNVIWGGWSLVEATLAGMAALIEMGAWEFAFNLSGQDYPIQSRAKLVSFLQAHRSQSFIEHVALKDDQQLRLNRLTYYHLETRRRVYRLPIRRRLPWPAYWGSAWIAPNRQLAEYFVGEPSLAPMKRFFRHTSISDENFFQVAALASPFGSTIQPRNLHVIEWDCDARGRAPEHPRTFTSADLPRILAAPDCFFARKFENEKVLDELDAHRRQN